MSCQYEGCDRQVVSGENCLWDSEGFTHRVDLCAYHLRKMAPDAYIPEWAEDQVSGGGGE